MAKNHNINNNPKEGNRMRNEKRKIQLDNASNLLGRLAGNKRISNIEYEITRQVFNKHFKGYAIFNNSWVKDTD